MEPAIQLRAAITAIGPYLFVALTIIGCVDVVLVYEAGGLERPGPVSVADHAMRAGQGWVTHQVDRLGMGIRNLLAQLEDTCTRGIRVQPYSL